MKLTLVLTHQCDLACSYCYAGAKFDRAMPRRVAERAIRRALLNVTPGDTLDLGFFGGEPLLKWPLARRLLQFAHHAAGAQGSGLRAQVTTNATHLDATTLDEALAFGVMFTISMDGLPWVHDAARPFRGGAPSSRAALAAIEALVARDASFFVNMVVRPETVAQLTAGARFLVNRGARQLLPSLDYGARWDQASRVRLAEAVAGLRELYVERHPDLLVGWLETKALLLANPALASPRCRGDEVAVAPSGRLYPCEREVGDDAADPGYGHVDDDGPLRLRGLACTRPVGGPCESCAYQPLCANDCACANRARTGQANVPDGLVCALEQACVNEAAAALEALRGRRRARSLPLAEVAHVSL